MAPILVPCLVALRAEFNRVNPTRDKASDGWIGDAAHALNPSDHNPDETGKTLYSDEDLVDEVHAIDVDNTGPWPTPTWFADTVDRIRLRHQAGDDDRLQNIIYDRRIASRSWSWTWRPYAGLNPHTEHAHFSARYTTAQEADTSPWDVYQEDLMPSVEEVVDGLLGQKLGSTGPSVAVALQDGYRNGVQADLKLDRALALLQALSGKDFTDEAAIADAVVAKLGAAASPQEKADLLRAALGSDAAEVGRLLAQ